MRSSSWHLTSRRSALVVGFVAVVAAVVILGMVSPSGKASGSGAASAVEYRREPVGKTSVPAFTRSVGQDRKHLVSPSNGGRPFLGHTPGLYAGTVDRQPCDRQALIRTLQADPEKAAAWSRLQHLRSADAIPGYVDQLTSVILRSDTYAKVYGYRGEVKPAPAVLQAGTAVLVNKRGVPVVKCNCGSPVTTSAPPRDARPRFTGPEWAGFSRSTVTVIRPAPKAVKRIIAVGVGEDKGELFKRPIGGGHGDGSDARDTILARGDYPAYLAMPGEQGAPDLPEAPKASDTPSDTITPLETERPSGSPSQQPQSQPSDQPTDPNQQPQPTDPNQQQPQQQPHDQTQPPAPQQPDPNQSQPPNQPPPNQPPPPQPPPNQPPPNQPPPQNPPDQNQQPQPQPTPPQPDPNQQQPPPPQQPPPSGP